MSKRPGAPAGADSGGAFRWAELGRAILEAAVLAVAVSVPLFFNPTTERVFEPDKLALLEVIGAVCVVGLLWRLIVEGWRPSPRGQSAIAVAMGVLFLSVVVASILGPRPDLSVWGSYRRATGLPVYAALVALSAAGCIALSRDEARTRWLRAVALAVLAASTYAVLQRLGYDSMSWDGSQVSPAERAFGPAGNPIFLGAYLAVGLPFVVAAAARSAGAVRVSYVAVACAGLVALVLSGSRGPLVGLAAGVGIAVVLAAARAGRRGLAAGILATGAGAALAAIALPALGLSQSVFAGSRTALERELLWKTIVGAMRSAGARLVVGYGPDSLGPLVTPRLGAALIALTPDQVYDRAHNLLLEWWITGGLVAVIAFTVLVASVLAAAARAIGLTVPRWTVVVAPLAAGASAAVMLALGSPEYAPLAAAGGLLVGAAACVIRGPVERASFSSIAGDGEVVLALAVAAALTAHVTEASFGLPTAPAAVVVWTAFGLAMAFGRTRDPEARAVPSAAAAADGMVDGLVLATIAFAPLLLPSPEAARQVPALWLLLPLLWVAGDVTSEQGGPVWVRPAARVGVLLVFGGLFALHPAFGEGGAAISYVVTMLAVVFALALALLRRDVGAGAVDVRARPFAVVAASLAGLLCMAAVLWLAMRPVVADAHVLASLRAGASGDLVSAVTQARRAVSLWPEQPALGTYVAAAHRGVMQDHSLAEDVREEGYRAAVQALEETMARAPSADVAAKLGDLHRDRGDLAGSGPDAESSWREALEWYDRSLAYQPAYPAALEAYALTLDRLGEYEGAQAMYERALVFDDRRLSVYGGLVRTKLARADLTGAIASLDQGLSIDREGIGQALDEAQGTAADPVRVAQSRLLYAIQAGGDPSVLAAQLERQAPDDPLTGELLNLAGDSQGN